MTTRNLILRSLRHRWRAHLGVVLGAAVGSAALIGALIVGDSVRESLRARALERLGWVEAAMDGGDRFFPSDLAIRISPIHSAPTSAARNTAQCEAVLSLPGTASRQDGTARANQVNILGVSPTFWRSQHSTNTPAALARIPAKSVVLNEALAAQLRAQPGDTIVLRLHKPTALSREVPIAPQNDASVALRLQVHAIAAATQRGDFSLRSGQTPPLNAYLQVDDLGSAAGLPGKANLILAGDFANLSHARSSFSTRIHSPIFRSQLDAWWWRLRSRLGGNPPPLSSSPNNPGGPPDSQMAWQPKLADFSLTLGIPTNQATLELRSERIFIEPAVTAVVFTGVTNRPGLVQSAASQGLRIQSAPTNTVSQELLNSIARPVLTYLANQLRAGTNATPYSMVTAAGQPWTPPDMRDDEILVNQWLADDLRLQPGDPLALTYFLAESGAQLVERTNQFRVRAIVPMQLPWADRALMPEFPGLAKAESTHEWDAGFPLVHKIRDQDEKYWKQYRGTPKAFVTLRAGQAMWGNRFGGLTSIRFPVPEGTDTNEFRARIENTLLTRLDPAAVGLRFEPVREAALRGASQSQDFGGLFIGFSLFLIAAALILMALLFQFGVEQRAAEIGTLLALGFTPGQVRRLMLWEGSVLALVGGVAGTVGGIVYARLMLRGLTTVWRDAVGTSALHFHVTPMTLAIGLTSAVAVSALTIWLVLRKQGRRSARELMAGEGQEDAGAALPRRSRAGIVAICALVFALGLAGWAMVTGDTNNAGIFFGAGALLLIAGLAFISSWLGRLATAESARSFTLGSLGVRGCTRRRKRSVAVAALLACGSFIVASIGVFRLDADAQAWKRSSGTGGFAFLGQSALPVVKDLNTKAGREFFGLEERDMEGVSFVPFRVRDGDEASCLNLNRAQKPRLLGVKPDHLRARFSFAQPPESITKASPWSGLMREQYMFPLGADEVPAIGDAASIQWALGKKIGDTIDYTDERGRSFKLKLVGGVANSILQGNLVIDEAEFVKRFPSESGYRALLVDAPSNRVSEVSAALSRGLQDAGLELIPASRRLAQFNAVQNTYLNTFQVLGGLGLLLGSAGLGVVVLRNVLERRAELAVLLAVGFRRRTLQRLVLSEHLALLALGLAAGLGAAFVSVLPAVWSPTMDLPLTSLGLTLAGVVVVGVAATWAATWFALRGQLLDSLRSE